MDAVFTLNYSELAVAKALHELLPKSGREAACPKYSITFPTSRQNKGWDLLAFSSESCRGARIQVKSSTWHRGARAKTARAKKRFTYYFWYNKFDVGENAADFYALFGLYPDPSNNANVKSSNAGWWHHRILLFTAAEMSAFLEPDDRFFDFGFDLDNPEHLYRIRGAQHPREDCYEQFVLSHRGSDLQSFLDGGSAAQRAFHHISAHAA